jgi:large subunit ribosomal protein L23
LIVDRGCHQALRSQRPWSQAFKVTVRRVNVQNYRGKNKRSRQGPAPASASDFKKAIVTLKTGDKIELV